MGGDGGNIGRWRGRMGGGRALACSHRRRGGGGWAVADGRRRDGWRRKKVARWRKEKKVGRAREEIR